MIELVTKNTGRFDTVNNKFEVFNKPHNDLNNNEIRHNYSTAFTRIL